MWAGLASAFVLAAVLSGLAAPWAALGGLAVWAGVSFGRESLKPPSPVELRLDARSVMILLLIVGGFLVLRWPIATHDVEHYIGPDEGEVVENVLEMIRMEDWDHRHRGYPGLHFYLQQIPARILMASTGRSIPELPRSDFYLLARRLTLLAGVLGAAATFLLARLWLPTWAGLLAAGLVASSPLAFRESAVVNPDLLLMLFVAASTAQCVRLLGRPGLSGFLLAGVGVGLSSAVKYTGVFAVAPYLLAWLIGGRPLRDWKRPASGLLAAAAAFALVSPYTFLNLTGFFEGLSMHVGYYSAARLNAPLALSEAVALRGLGVVASLFALAAVSRTLSRFDRVGLVLLAYPLTYWLVFGLFDRAYPRHALPLLPFAAVFAGAGAARGVSLLRGVLSSVPGNVLAALLVSACLLEPGLASLGLSRRLEEETPADLAARWAEANLTPESRVLEDQYTPRLDAYRTHRLRVEEKYFVGNYDWVFRSGYPPGLATRGLREVTTFLNDDALGDPITLYQVPERSVFMPVSLSGAQAELSIGAGELAYFGEGWHAASPGAHGTSRLSRGEYSEIYLELGPRASDVPEALDVELRGNGVANAPLEVRIHVNEHEALPVSVPGASEDPGSSRFRVHGERLRPGLNRIVLGYGSRVRIDRRHPDTALRLYGIRIRKASPSVQPDDPPQSLEKSNPSSVN